MTTSAPTATSLAWWAHFTFPHAQRVGQQVTFREDDAQIRQALPARLRHSRYPWRWRFGDGTMAWGDHVTHIYHSAGHYKLAVDVYGAVQGKGAWLTFDAVTVTVRS